MILFQFVFSFLISCSSADPTIHFRALPQWHEGSVVYLRDVAEIKGLPATQVIELGELILALHPEDYRKLSKVDLIRKIRQQTTVYEHECDCRVQLIFARSPKEEQKAETFSLPIVQEEIVQRLQKTCPSCTFQLSNLNVLRGQVPSTFSHWDLQHDLRDLRGAVMLRVYFDDQVLNPLILQTWVRVQRPVLVIQKALMKGHIAQASDFVVQLRDVTNEQRSFADVKDLLGKELKRSLNNAQLLTMDDLVDRQSVKLGESVAVEIQNGSIFVEMSGTAQRGGKLGERIPIRIHKTQKQITAVIVGDSRVRL